MDKAIGKRILVSAVLILVVVAAAAAAITIMYLTRPAPQKAAPEPVIPTVVAPRLMPAELRVQIVGYGSARPRVLVRISPEVTGEVVFRAANFQSGMYVSRGQVLFRIDPSDYKLARDLASQKVRLLEASLARLNQDEQNLKATAGIEADRLRLAQASWKRTTALKARGVSTDNEVDIARGVFLARRRELQNASNQLAVIGPRRKELQAQLATAGVNLAQAELNLKRTTFTSPVTGRVIERSIEVGERCHAGTICGRLYGIEVMEVPISVPAGDLRWIDCEAINARTEGESGARAMKIPAKVYWHGPAGEHVDRPWLGYVERVEAGLEARTRTATLVVQVTNPPATGLSSAGSAQTKVGPSKSDSPRPLLDINMFCKVVVRGRKVAAALMLPRRAIRPDGTVYVVSGGRLAKGRKVKVARFTDDQAMILPGGGLNSGDRVVQSYIPKPVIGMAVRAVDDLKGLSASTTAPARLPAPTGRRKGK